MLDDSVSLLKKKDVYTLSEWKEQEFKHHTLIQILSFQILPLFIITFYYA